MIPGLDGVRAIAFLLVFFLHTDYLYFGWVGVQLFFVLSGFLITDILLRMKEKFSAGDYFKKFYGRRFLRIFPLYYLYLLIIFVVTIIVIYYGYRVAYMQRTQEQFPYALAYIYNFFNASSAYDGESWLIGHLWSLSVEEQFYIFWPLLIFLTPKKHLKKLFVAAIIAGPLFRAGISFLYKYYDVPFMFPDYSVVTYVLPFSHLDAFGLGAFISRFEIPKARWQFIALLLLLPIIGFATTYWSTGSLGDITALGFRYPLAKDMKQVWGYVYLNYVCALFIYIVVKEKFLVGFLDKPFIGYLGKISYGLYVYHFAIVWFVARIRDLSVPIAIAKPLTLVISAILLYFIASLSYKYFEKPILDLKDKYFQTSDDKKATG
ncbi:MAG: acyltransferase family protein [Chloroflexota bacterium]